MQKGFRFVRQWGLFILIAISWYFFQPADFGDLIFLFVYENICALLGLFVFIATTDAYLSFVRKDSSLGEKLLAPVLNIISHLIVLSGLILYLLFINQLSIEFLIAYMCPNGICDVSSLSILNRGLFLEPTIIKALFKNYPMGLRAFTFLIISFTAVDLSIKAWQTKDSAKESLSINYFLGLAANATAMAISILVVSILWTIANEITVINNNIIIILLIVLRIIYLQLLRLAIKLMELNEA